MPANARNAGPRKCPQMPALPYGSAGTGSDPAGGFMELVRFQGRHGRRFEKVGARPHRTRDGRDIVLEWLGKRDEQREVAGG